MPRGVWVGVGWWGWCKGLGKGWVGGRGRVGRGWERVGAGSRVGVGG